jgi:hypothetical protein
MKRLAAFPSALCLGRTSLRKYFDSASQAIHPDPSYSDAAHDEVTDYAVYTCSLVMSDQEYSELVRTTRERIRNITRVNFKGQKYIKLQCLRQLFCMNLVYDLLRSNYGKELPGPRLNLHNVKSGDEIDEVRSKALRLLGLCVLANVPLSTFLALLSNGFRDANLPLNAESFHLMIRAGQWECFREYQSHFIPYLFSDNGVHHNVPASMPLPIIFNELDDRIGHGSFSEVYRVKVDLEAKPLNEVCCRHAQRFFRR